MLKSSVQKSGTSQVNGKDDISAMLDPDVFSYKTLEIFHDLSATIAICSI